MTPAQHRAKATRIERSAKTCAATDYETLIEAAMLAGTHWLNYYLHLVGLTTVAHDIMHAEHVTVAERRRIGLVRPGLLDAMDRIEALRAPYVRGNVEGGSAAAREAQSLLAQLREAALAAQPNPRFYRWG